MRNIILILSLLITSYNLIAQTPKERIKALKSAYITKELDLTNKEAKEFWPIYEAYDQELEDNRRKQARKIIEQSEGIDKMSKKEADELIAEYLKAEKALYIAQENLIKNLEGIISSQRIAKLLIAERTFNQRMLQRFRRNSGED